MTTAHVLIVIFRLPEIRLTAATTRGGREGGIFDRIVVHFVVTSENILDHMILNCFWFGARVDFPSSGRALPSLPIREQA